MHKTVRIDIRFNAKGGTKQTGEDDISITLGKLLNNELYRGIKKLRGDSNNLRNSVRKVFGSSVDHPQGGIVSLSPKDDETDTITRLADVMKNNTANVQKLEAEAVRLQRELDKYVESGEFDEQCKKLGLDPKRIRRPSVDFGVVIAVDPSVVSFDEVREYLANENASISNQTLVRQVKGNDEKILVIMENLAKKMGEHYIDLQKRINDRKAKDKDPLTRDDIIAANSKFAHSLDGEREKIRVVLGDTPQMEQVDNLLNKLMDNGRAMIDVFSEVSLSDGTPLSEAINIDNMVVGTIKSDDELMEALGVGGIDEI